MDRQRVRTSGTTGDNEWQRVTTNKNEWQRVVQLVTSDDNEWQRVVISANLPFLRIREKPITKDSKENFLNPEEDLEEGLLNKEQKQTPKKN